MNQNKIIFTGPSGAGKTTALQNLSDIAHLSLCVADPSIETRKHTDQVISIENGQIQFNGAEIDLYITPILAQIEVSLSVLSEDAIATVIFIHHAQKSALAELENYLKLFIDHTDNIVVAVTHVDQDSQQLLKKYRNWMLMQSYRMPIFAIDPRKKQDVELLIETVMARELIQNAE